MKIIKMKKEVNRDDLIYKTGNKKSIKIMVLKASNSFGREIYNAEFTLEDALEKKT